MSELTKLLTSYCPNGVEYKKIGEIGVLFGGLTGKSKEDFKNGNAKFITYRNIYSNPSLDLNIQDKVKILDDEKQHTVRYGDILFTGSSETPDECGMSSVVTVQTNEDLYLNSFCFGLRLHKLEEYNLNFLKHLLRSNEVRGQIKQTASGVTRYNISKKRFVNISIPVPPIEVQTKIAEILDRFAEYAAELQAELQARQEQYEYYRSKLLTFDEIVGGGIQGVIWMKMSEVYDMKAGKTIISSMIENVKTLKNPYPCYGGNGLRGYVSEYNQQGDKVLIGRQGALCGNVCFANNSFYATEHAVVVSEKGYCLPRYTYHLLTKMKLNQYKTAGAQPGLSVSRLEKLLIPIPSMGMQLKIVSILDRFDELISDLSQGLPAEIAAVQEQYEYYRDKLLSFPEYKLSA